MPEKEFLFPDRPPGLAAQLWPAAPFNAQSRLRSGFATRLKAQWGSAQRDVGALRETAAGALEIIYGGGWTPFDPGHHGHMGIARKFYRYGPGHSENGVLDPHDFAQQDLRDLSAKDPVAWPPRISLADGPPRHPGDEPIEDVSYDPALYKRVQDAKRATGGGSPPPPPSSELNVTPAKLEFKVSAPGTQTASLNVATAKRWTATVEPTKPPPDVPRLPPGSSLARSPNGGTGPGSVEVSLTVVRLPSKGRYGATSVVSIGTVKVVVPVLVEVGDGGVSPPPPTPPPPTPPPPPPVSTPLTPEELVKVRKLLAEWEAGKL